MTYQRKFRVTLILLGSAHMVGSVILLAAGHWSASYLLALLGMGLMFYNIGWVESEKDRP